MDRPGQTQDNTDTKVILIWIGIAVAAILIVLVIIVLILLFIRARRKFRELDEDMHMKSFQRSLAQYEEEGTITRVGRKRAPSENISSPKEVQPKIIMENNDGCKGLPRGEITDCSLPDGLNNLSIGPEISVLSNNSPREDRENNHTNADRQDDNTKIETPTPSKYYHHQTKNTKRKQVAENRLKAMTSSDTDSETKVAPVNVKAAKKRKNRNRSSKDKLEDVQLRNITVHVSHSPTLI
ncbi:uncharacterized protein LOC144446029 [Glandiceps talaboti]